jgi:hypothetical protein
MQNKVGKIGGFVESAKTFGKIQPFYFDQMIAFL